MVIAKKKNWQKSQNLNTFLCWWKFVQEGRAGFCSFLFLLYLPALHCTPSSIPPYPKEQWGRGDQGTAESRVNKKTTAPLSFPVSSDHPSNAPFIFNSKFQWETLTFIKGGGPHLRTLLLIASFTGMAQPCWSQFRNYPIPQIPKRCDVSYQSFMPCTDLPHQNGEYYSSRYKIHRHIYLSIHIHMHFIPIFFVCMCIKQWSWAC